MADITIIPSVRLDNHGLRTTQADGKQKNIALYQGSLDSACAVYSTIIALMCLRQIDYEDVAPKSGNIDKRSPKGKFLSLLLEQRGMKLGWNLKTLAKEINDTSDFNVKATAVRKDFVDRIYDCIQDGLPAIVGITFISDNGGHAIACVGVEDSDEYEDTPVKLLCIDPARPMTFPSYWNCVIIVPRKHDDDSDYTYMIADDVCKIKVDDTIVF